MKKAVSTAAAPSAIGPYSQAIRSGNTIYLSGQLGVAPSTGNLVSTDVREQTRQALENLKAVLAAAGATPAQVCKTTVFLTDMEDFAAVNAVYAQVFGVEAPARSCVAVAALPKGGKVEVEAVAVLD